jgi:starch synthase
MSKEKAIKVLLASPEIAPFAKTGGLADVCEALPKALVPLGVAPTLVLPLYRSVKQGKWELEKVLEALPIRLGADEIEATILRAWPTKDIPVFFVQQDDFFDRESLYGTSKGDYADNAVRFSFFSGAVLALAKALGQQWDIIHCHDWQTALIPVYLRVFYANTPPFSQTRTILTIHNLGYQGIFPAGDFPRLGLPAYLFATTGLEFWGKVNLLKGGILFTDQVTTVSPTYAKEILTPELGYGLDAVLQAKAGGVIGILDGVDYSIWNPEDDPLLAARYSRGDLSGKRACKEDLLRRCQLSPDLIERPLLGMTSRLAGQKGIDLVCQVADRVMAQGAGLVILGSGERRYTTLLTKTARKYPKQMAVNIVFDEALAHRIEAGCDIYLMPSLYEPCGLSQMYSLKYGTIPVVRHTGGLVDTVVEADPEKKKGTGFTFIDYHPDAFWKAIEKAMRCFADKELWQLLMRQAMAQDFSWSHSGGEYFKLYQRLLNP